MRTPKQPQEARGGSAAALLPADFVARAQARMNASLRYMSHLFAQCEAAPRVVIPPLPLQPQQTTELPNPSRN